MIPIQQLPKSPTRKCFEEAFLELYAQKPLDQISVMVLTEKAGYSTVPRSTLRARKLLALGWRPRFSLEEGLAATLEIARAWR